MSASQLVCVRRRESGFPFVQEPELRVASNSVSRSEEQQQERVETLAPLRRRDRNSELHTSSRKSVRGQPFARVGPKALRPAILGARDRTVPVQQHQHGTVRVASGSLKRESANSQASLVKSWLPRG